MKAKKYKVSINTIPTKGELRLLLNDVQQCLDYYDTGGQLTYDHLENSIARILELPQPNVIE